jgi:hypothetical protein
MRFFTRMFKDWLSDPPAIQRPAGLKIDSDFAPPEPGFWQTLFGIGSDGRVYTMDAADHKRLRPVVLRDPRAIKNEAIAAAARQRRASRSGDLPITIIPYGREEYEPTLAHAEILPPVPRPAPDAGLGEGWDFIEMPGGGDGRGGGR